MNYEWDAFWAENKITKECDYIYDREFKVPFFQIHAWQIRSGQSFPLSLLFSSRLHCSRDVYTDPIFRADHACDPRDPLLENVLQEYSQEI